MSEPLKRSQNYLEQAQRAEEAAAATPLENLRQRHVQAAVAWRDLAAAEIRREAERDRRAEIARDRDAATRAAAQAG